jgi:hypothetical protein
VDLSTNAFSKKLENHRAAIALHFMHYNFCRVHQTLRVTPAMEAGIADHVWHRRGCCFVGLKSKVGGGSGGRRKTKNR